MDARDASRPWPGISNLPGIKARALLERIDSLESTASVTGIDTPTWWTALAARAARQALEKPKKGPLLQLDGNWPGLTLGLLHPPKNDS